MFRGLTASSTTSTFFIFEFRSDFSCLFVSFTILEIILWILFCFVRVVSIKFVMVKDWPWVLKIISPLSSVVLVCDCERAREVRDFISSSDAFDSCLFLGCATASVVTLSFRKAGARGWIRCSRLGRHFVCLGVVNVKYLYKFSSSYVRNVTYLAVSNYCALYTTILLYWLMHTQVHIN